MSVALAVGGGPTSWITMPGRWTWECQDLQLTPQGLILPAGLRPFWDDPGKVNLTFHAPILP